MSLHSFDPEIASRVGVNAAVIYQNILFWTRKNLANGKHVYEGKVWTYNSIKALNELFDYLSPAQIRHAIQKLLEAGMISEGNFNLTAYDRTKWYGVPCEIHLGKMTNGSEKNSEPIPDSKTNIKPDSKPKEEAKASLSPGDDLADAVTAYNIAAKESGWPQVQVLSKQRRSALAARLRECGGLAGWQAALAKAQASPHLCGDNDRGWTCSFDFLAKQSSFTKIMEGNYDRRATAHQSAHRADAALENILRLAGVGEAPGNGGSGIGGHGEEDGPLWLGQGSGQRGT